MGGVISKGRVLSYAAGDTQKGRVYQPFNDSYSPFNRKQTRRNQPRQQIQQPVYLQQVQQPVYLQQIQQPQQIQQIPLPPPPPPSPPKEEPFKPYPLRKPERILEDGTSSHTFTMIATELKTGKKYDYLTDDYKVMKDLVVTGNRSGVYGHDHSSHHEIHLKFENGFELKQDHYETSKDFFVFRPAKSQTGGRRGKNQRKRKTRVRKTYSVDSKN